MPEDPVESLIRNIDNKLAARDLVPSRRQYLELKRKYPHAILLYRMGDFYEAFDDDARVVARDARVTLTSRTFGRSGRVPMAGVPHHALNYYLSRLLNAGHTVAIAEQMSEPGKGLVEREVTRVLTPGTVVESALLPAGENRYLAAVYDVGARIGIAWVDVSTGEFRLMELRGDDASERLQEELARISPAECLIPEGFPYDLVLSQAHATTVRRQNCDPQVAYQLLCKQFSVRSLDAFGCHDAKASLGAAGAIYTYIEQTNPSLLCMLTSIRMECAEDMVGMDPATRRNLELTRSFGTGGSRGSLLGVVDQTSTPMGSRAMRRLINTPLRDLQEIRRRQDIIESLVQMSQVRARIANQLVQIGDLERAVSRCTQSGSTLRDFLSLSSALGHVDSLVRTLSGTHQQALANLASSIDTCEDILSRLQMAVAEADDGSPVILPGFMPELGDALEELRSAREWLARLEQKERERTGIRSLKVGYNKVFGYYIEVTRPNLHLVPRDYVRKQTISTGERFVTEALKEVESRITRAEDAIERLQNEAIALLRSLVSANTRRLLATAQLLAEMDALVALAEVASRCGWVRPLVDDSEVIEIRNGRHPVVEASLEGERFVPNDCYIGGNWPRVLLITGPNMGGKSTYLRQVALIVLLAQIGSFVPAESARIGLVDRIFTRVGAHDDLARGASTFMVEMVETATILNGATERSLVVLDEIGRGTSTYDGMAIAQAVLEDIHDRVRARTLFATHYLELTTVAKKLPSAQNVHVSVAEERDHIVFLYSVRPGAADRAYGIHVARLAGLPPWVAGRAENILHALSAGTEGESTRDKEDEGANSLVSKVDINDASCHLAKHLFEPGERYTCSDNPLPVKISAVKTLEGNMLAYQGVLEGFEPSRSELEGVAEDILDTDLACLSPVEALQKIEEWQQRLRGMRSDL